MSDDLIFQAFLSLLELARENIRRCNNSDASQAEYEYYCAWVCCLEFAIVLFAKYDGFLYRGD